MTETVSGLIIFGILVLIAVIFYKKPQKQEEIQEEIQEVDLEKDANLPTKEESKEEMEARLDSMSNPDIDKPFAKISKPSQVESVDIIEHMITEEDMKMNPSLVEEGIAAGDIVEIAVEVEAELPKEESVSKPVRKRKKRTPKASPSSNESATDQNPESSVDEKKPVRRRPRQTKKKE